MDLQRLVIEDPDNTDRRAALESDLAGAAPITAAAPATATAPSTAAEAGGTESPSETIDFHPGLTVAFHQNPTRRHRFIEDLVDALGPGHDGLHVEVIDGRGRPLVAFRPRNARHRVIDTGQFREVSDAFLNADGRVDLLGRSGLDPTTTRRLVRVNAGRLDRGAGRGSDDPRLARRLAALDQDELWTAAERLAAAEARLNAAAGRLGEGVVRSRVDATAPSGRPTAATSGRAPGDATRDTTGHDHGGARPTATGAPPETAAFAAELPADLPADLAPGAAAGGDRTVGRTDDRTDVGTDVAVGEPSVGPATSAWRPEAAMAAVEAARALQLAADTHDRSEAAARAHRGVLMFGAVVAGACLVASGLLLAFDTLLDDNRWTAKVLVLLAALAIVLALSDRRGLVAVRRHERRLLASLGVPSYEAMLAGAGPLAEETNRHVLLDAAAAYEPLATHWRLLSGGAPLHWALEHRPAITELADRRRRAAPYLATDLANDDGNLADSARLLVDRIVELRAVGLARERLPAVLDDPFVGLDAGDIVRLLETVRRLAASHQIVLVTGNPDIAGWAAPLAATGEIGLVRLADRGRRR